MTDKKPVTTCIKDSCDKCNIGNRLNCHVTFSRLLRFYLIVLPTFITGGIGIYSSGILNLMVWIIIIGLFFLIMEIKVLCSHCPHYYGSSDILRCRANYGVPKIWKYNPVPMNIFEKIALIFGFIVVWGYPVIFIYLVKNWILLIIYIISVILFFTILRLYCCKKCINFFCPLNAVSDTIKNEFFKKESGNL